jgi:Leucine-rich repeat (LRR) protein
MLFLNSLPLVEEVWLQDNNISQISGLEFNTQNLKILHLSNNPISSFKELYKLIVNINLIELILK